MLLASRAAEIRFADQLSFLPQNCQAFQLFQMFPRPTVPYNRDRKREHWNISNNWNDSNRWNGWNFFLRSVSETGGVNIAAATLPCRKPPAVWASTDDLDFILIIVHAVTGGARGIGKAVTLAYARAGARMVICASTDRNKYDGSRDSKIESGRQRVVLDASTCW